MRMTKSEKLLHLVIQVSSSSFLPLQADQADQLGVAVLIEVISSGDQDFKVGQILNLGEGILMGGRRHRAGSWSLHGLDRLERQRHGGGGRGEGADGGGDRPAFPPWSRRFIEPDRPHHVVGEARTRQRRRSLLKELPNGIRFPGFAFRGWGMRWAFHGDHFWKPHFTGQVARIFRQIG